MILKMSQTWKKHHNLRKVHTFDKTEKTEIEKGKE